MNESHSTTVSTNAAFSALVPVLLQCFGVILLGFLAGKFEVLSDLQVKGLGIYVTKFALPAIFFTVMVTIDFSGVDWYVVLAVSLGKLVMFVVTMALTLIVSRGRNIGLAGLLAMFTSQSNDVALAYPVLRLMYPDLASYIYLFAPAQLMILNPFSYFALEWHSAREQVAVDAALISGTNSVEVSKVSVSEKRKMNSITRKDLLKVLCHVISNPLFFMTVIGVIFNFILSHKLPFFLEGLFKSLGESFGATALFYLGFSMVGRLNKINRRRVYILVLILLGKILILPFITRSITVLLVSNQSSEISLEKANFAFLYAGAPTAPPVFLFASQYGVEPEVIGAGLVIGTFLFAPITFLFAGMSSIANIDSSFYDTMLQRTAVFLSWSSIACCTWTIVILALKRKDARIPYPFLVCLIGCIFVFSFVVAIGSIWFPMPFHAGTYASWVQCLLFANFFFAVSAARVWSSLIAASLLLRKFAYNHLSLRLQILFYILGFAIPLTATAVLMLTGHKSTVLDINPVFHYGRAQQICSVLLLIGCISTTLICLVLLFHCNSNRNHEISSHKTNFSFDCHDYLPLQTENKFSSINEDSQILLLSDNNEPINVGKPILKSDITPSKLDDLADDLHRYFLLLILLVISMFFGLCICLWRLIRETDGSVFIVVEFLDQTFNFGQGIIIFAVFGIDSELVITPMSRLFSRIRQRALLFSTGLPSSMHLVNISQNAVESFSLVHFAECSAAISRSLTLSNVCLSRVFSFGDFHEWLLSKGLTDSREASFSLLLALEEAGRVRHLNRISGKALFTAKEIEDSRKNNITFRERASLFQFLWD